MYIFVFLHQTATSAVVCIKFLSCISLFSYIKPQLAKALEASVPCCISLFSYIKPQPVCYVSLSCQCCISLFSYIKPQLDRISNATINSCISLFSYIKPQLQLVFRQVKLVVYLCFPTSNRNTLSLQSMIFLLYIFVFLHQTATVFAHFKYELSCISLFSYIKPQRRYH